MNNERSISIVTPMYNEKECLPEFYSRTRRVLERMGHPFEIILIDDGSTDGTDDLIRKLCAEDERVVGVFLSRNRGQSTAIYAGIQHSTGGHVIIMDGDLQNPPEEIPLLVAEAHKGADMVKGVRQGRRESLLLRRIPSLIANYLIRKISRCDVRDMGGFSCIRGDLARTLQLRTGQHRFIPALVFIAGGTVVQVPTSAPKRFAGKSHYGIGRSIDVFFDIVMLWFQTSNKQRPMYFFGRVSLLSFAFSGLLFAWTLVDKVFAGRPMANRPPFFIAIVLFLGSLGLLVTGFMFEILTATYDGMVQNKPYVVRETRNLKKKE
jgi:glycosyltransferase involved in cell wall biosynthesis